jgi:uncharacterized membrane protein YbhN (UPF0104 family)
MGIPKADAAAVVLLDRLLTYYSVALFGFVVYVLSNRKRLPRSVVQAAA